MRDEQRHLGPITAGDKYLEGLRGRPASFITHRKIEGSEDSFSIYKFIYTATPDILGMYEKI